MLQSRYGSERAVAIGCLLTLLGPGARSDGDTPALRATPTVSASAVSPQSLRGLGEPRIPADRGWGIDQGFPGDPLVSFALNDPGNPSLVASGAIPTFVNGCDFAGNNLTTLYALSSQPDAGLYAIDTATGVATRIGTADPTPVWDWLAMSWDPASQVMYALAGDLSATTLYSIDLSTGASTFIGPTNWGGLIGLAINCQGEAFAYALLSGVFGRISLETGAFTPIGQVGFFPNYGQGMDFDDSTGQLYMAAYDAATSRAELRGVDVNTGATTLVGALGWAGLSHFGSIAIAQRCDYEPPRGACCHEVEGTCAEDISLIDCLAPSDRFIANGSCAQFEPACGRIPGACCSDDGTCGVISRAECRTIALGDVNCDGSVDFFDIDPFVTALSGPDVYYQVQPNCNWLNADTSRDFAVTFGDIDPFVALLGEAIVPISSSFLGANTACGSCPCVVACPLGSALEQEPCGAALNNGCDLYPEPAFFAAITSGQTVCGNVYSDGASRDTDWYELTLDAPAEITIDAAGEFQGYAGLHGQYVPGLPGCENLSGTIWPMVNFGDCGGGVIESACLPQGTHYLQVAPYLSPGVQCPSDYTLRVVAEPCTLPVGACCLFPSGSCQSSLTSYQCDALLGIWQGPDVECSSGLCPAAPTNDVCEAATLVATLPAVIDLDNTYATDDLTPDCAGPNNGPPRKGVWYQIVGTGNRIQVSTCNPGSTNSETAIQVFCGCDMGVCVGGNDNDDVCEIQPPWASTFEWCTIAGQPYFVLVGGGYEFATGPIQLSFFDFGAPCSPSGAETCIPCVVACRSGDVPEEEACGTFANDGCALSPPAVERLACNSVKCGTLVWDGVAFDSDWYEVSLPESAVLTLVIESEFEARLGLAQQIYPGTPGCEYVTGFVTPAEVSLPCIPASVQSDCLQPGIYYVRVDTTFGAHHPCPATYRLALSCTPCTPSYCAATTGYCSEVEGREYINGLLLHTLTNLSGCGLVDGYSDYTALSTTLGRGQSYPLAIANGSQLWPADACGVWIDWNQNAAFEPGEAVSIIGSPSVGPYTGTVIVPSDAPLGSCRLRARIVGGFEPLSPCGLVSFGEVEDYTVIVQP